MKKIFLLVLAALLPSLALGYEFEVSPLERQGNIKQQVFDANGEICAGLFVKTKIKNIQFSFGGLGFCSVEKVSGGYEIYLPLGSTFIGVSAPGFKALRWELGLKSGVAMASYAAQVSRIGQDPKSFSAETDKISAVWEQEDLFSVASHFQKGRSPIIKIHTDLPFDVVEKQVLLPGKYEVGQLSDGDYRISVPVGTKVGEVAKIKALSLPEDVAQSAMQEGTVYSLDLSWQKDLSRELAKNLQKANRSNQP